MKKTYIAPETVVQTVNLQGVIAASFELKDESTSQQWVKGDNGLDIWGAQGDDEGYGY